MKKKLFLTIAIMFLLTIFAVPTQVHAKTPTSKQAVSWVRKQAKAKKKFKNGQCVDLIEAYYSYLGQTPNVMDAYKYATASLPKGWKRVKGGTPKAGDIVLFSKNKACPYGHIAIYVGAKESYHQNFNGAMYTRKWTYNIKKLNCKYWGYIRPNWGK